MSSRLLASISSGILLPAIPGMLLIPGILGIPGAPGILGAPGIPGTPGIPRPIIPGPPGGIEGIPGARVIPLGLKGQQTASPPGTGRQLNPGPHGIPDEHLLAEGRPSGQEGIRSVIPGLIPPGPPGNLDMPSIPLVPREQQPPTPFRIFEQVWSRLQGEVAEHLPRGGDRSGHNAP